MSVRCALVDPAAFLALPGGCGDGDRGEWHDAVGGASTLGVEPWAPDADLKERRVRIQPTEVHGRWFELPAR
ncbi:hypothetical protein JIX56_00185 [Streptomyces sp. CA-210063]|uniref:hypothetical protein n=1 Tax=Streptomyces sp. CA-210063 TaxID=2801029 RepID=UPI00214C3FB0|nr:hypothetical protein [Streptomyces sp. CA-210063]UUU28467.1 hypothetical protein JIX56_00185 [Streptomyces sp. CA-210063]